MSKVLSYKFFILLLYFNGIISVYGQKKFNFTISFTGSAFNTKNLTVNFYEGYNAQSILLKSFNKIVEAQTSNLKYPVLEFFYFSSKHKPTIYRFFLIKYNSAIKINYVLDKDELIIEETNGVLSFKDAGQKMFEEFAKNELSRLQVFEKKYNYDFTKLDSATLNQLNNFTAALRDKSIEFIKTNPKSLYSLWLFMNEVIGKPNYSFEYLNTIYSKYLQPNFKYTFENKYILSELDTNRLAITANTPYQNVSFTDLSGNKHKIKDFRGKPLIIMIWATWCVPCIADIPKLKELYLKFENRLELISFSLDNNEKNYKRFVTKNSMDWINVYGRYDFCKVYGADKGIPQVYLIDKNGTIVYSRSIFKDYDLNKLSTIVEQILAYSSFEKDVSN